MNKEFDDQWWKMTDESSFFRQEVIVFILLLFVYLYTGSVRCLNHSVHSVESLSEHSGWNGNGLVCVKGLQNGRWRWYYTRSLYFAVRLSFRCCHNKTHLWSILLFLSVWLSPDECRRLWSVWHIVRVLFLFSMGEAALPTFTRPWYRVTAGHCRDRHLRRIRCPALVSAFCRQRRWRGGGRLWLLRSVLLRWGLRCGFPERKTLWGIPDGCLHLKGRDFRPPMWGGWSWRAG